MNVVLWVLQAILAVKLFTTGLSHGVGQNKPAMADAIRRIGAPARLLLWGIAALTDLGIAGLLLPGLLGRATWLVPLSACGVAVAFLASMALHRRCRETPRQWVSLILALLATFVAYGRWRLAPL